VARFIELKAAYEEAKSIQRGEPVFFRCPG
jgi:hypothetical protein